MWRWWREAVLPLGRCMLFTSLTCTTEINCTFTAHQVFTIPRLLRSRLIPLAAICLPGAIANAESITSAVLLDISIPSQPSAPSPLREDISPRCREPLLESSGNGGQGGGRALDGSMAVPLWAGPPRSSREALLVASCARLLSFRQLGESGCCVLPLSPGSRRTVIYLFAFATKVSCGGEVLSLAKGSCLLSRFIYS